MNLNQKTLEKIKEINYDIKDKNPKLTVIGFINGYYKNNSSRAIVECKDHGIGSKFGNPWNPSYSSLKSGYGCPKCSKTYYHTTEEAIKELNNKININLEFIGFIDGKYKGAYSRTIVKCKKHGLGCDFDNPWNPIYRNLKNGIDCIKCAGNYFKTNDDAISELNNQLFIINPKLKFIGFVDGEYKNNKSRAIIECNEHGIGCNFDKPWNPTYEKLIAGNSCPKCAGNYIKTNDEAILELNKTINPDLKFIGFIDGKYKDAYSKTIVECKEHGLGCNFNIPWNPIYRYLKSGIVCPKCTFHYKQTKEEAINEINNILYTKKSNLRVIGFIGDEYKGAYSRTIVECKEHGLCCNFDRPWNPTYESLRTKKGCTKCSGKYMPITEESIIEINKIINSNLKIIGFIDDEYKGTNSKVIIECKIHGIGCNFDKPWNPTYGNLQSGYGCPICSVEKKQINELLKNPIHFNSNRNIYFITFKNLKNNKKFYKIGVSTDKGHKRRFSQLKKDNIKIIKSKEIKTNNIFALLTEYYVLTNFQEYKKPMYHILKYNKGGSECFDYDLTKILTLEEMINNAINNFDILINNFDLTDEELINAKKEFLKINNI